ncbi:M-phase inducer phosphatase-like isoform X2 [Zerene cesonia]|uniref:M-phase inducer phosphatase-like isoform X2 n=1 Tax=Zerene cesonia TaxID=33412 RepID=UPI0018E520B3|nr:M-phase inducer phosphatase-like isoform X2 [Zerene cesonia]
MFSLFDCCFQGVHARLITENFRINSGNNAKKRKQEEAHSHNYKIKVRPHSIDFNKQSSPLTPQRRVLGEIQNSPIARKVFNDIQNSPIAQRKSFELQNSPIAQRKVFNDISSPSQRRVLGEIQNSPFTGTTPTRLDKSPFTHTVYSPKLTPLYLKESPLYKNSPTMERLRSPLIEARERKRNKISRIFEDRNKFRANKENERFNIEEETQDCMFGQFETKNDWSESKLDFTNLQTKADESDIYVPEKALPVDTDFETLHDLEEEFDAQNFDECKYEIISTDSPNIISTGRSNTRKINAGSFIFGAPLSDSETSTSFNKPTTSRALNFKSERTKSTRVLNFDEDFEFTSPKKTLSVKKSLKFSESPKFEKSNSITSVSSSISKRLTSESVESGFISEFEEPFLDIEEISSSPKISNFSDLLSGQIKDSFTEKLKVHRSLSFDPRENNKRVSEEESGSSKRLKAEHCARPVLQRAFSENNASIMSALARSACEPDLIGDFSLPFALPLTTGDHVDLKSISCDTLAALIRGEYTDTVHDYQVIDCRYPYEYEGGHILGAKNLYTSEQILQLMEAVPQRDGSKRSILVFHCEFSLERGPKLSRFLRSTDRARNKDKYPSLHYPEVYLLHAGYRAFFTRHPQLCSPAGYTAMLDPKHRQQLRQHRAPKRKTFRSFQ